MCFCAFPLPPTSPTAVKVQPLGFWVQHSETRIDTIRSETVLCHWVRQPGKRRAVPTLLYTPASKDNSGRPALRGKEGQFSCCLLFIDSGCHESESPLDLPQRTFLYYRTQSKCFLVKSSVLWLIWPLKIFSTRWLIIKAPPRRTESIYWNVLPISTCYLSGPVLLKWPL